MSDPAVPIGSPVHPHQLEVQEFSSYALVIDARSRAEYDEDHIPGAVSVPVAEVVGSQHLEPALSVAESGSSLPYRLAALVGGLRPDDAVLVYCARGGLDSEVWAKALRARGWAVDVLGGGWPNYRRWVTAGLEALPRALTFRVLHAPPAGGVDLLLRALSARGAQTLDLAELVGPGAVPGVVPAVISQSAFESRLLDALRAFESDRDIWISDWASASMLQLPPALRDQMQRSRLVHLDVPVDERARWWAAVLSSRVLGIDDVIADLSSFAEPPAARLVEQWRAMSTLSVEIALASMLVQFLDRSYSTPAGDASRLEHVLHIDSLTPEGVASVLDRWLEDR